MPGLDPGIHSGTRSHLTSYGMDCRVKPGNDDKTIKALNGPTPSSSRS